MMQHAFVTGVTGTLGRLIAKTMAAKGYRVTGYSRDEFKQGELEELKHPNITLVLGDVRDRDRLLESTRGVDILFHTAALKQVPKLEENPEESIATNITGTQNVLFSQRMNGIGRVVLSSTDKACYPVNVYGACKAVAEKLVLRNPSNVVVRYGNVLASRGSVVPIFVESLKTNGYVALTDPLMSRFWLTQPEACMYTVNAALNADKGGLAIPPLKASPVRWLAEVIAELLEIEHFNVEEAGIRAGEKIHEVLRTEEEGEYIYSGNPDYWFSRKELLTKLKPVVEAICESA